MSETKCAGQLALFSVGKQQVTVYSQGGQIVTDAGLLPLASERRILTAFGLRKFGQLIDRALDAWRIEYCRLALRFYSKKTIEQSLFCIFCGSYSLWFNG